MAAGVNRRQWLGWVGTRLLPMAWGGVAWTRAMAVSPRDGAAATAPVAVGASRTPPPPLVLASVAAADIDPRGHLVSEKLDGVRAFWTGHELRHRSGATIPLPDGFSAGWPAQALDGELWLGRGRFDALAALLRRDPARRSADDLRLWQQVRYCVFELPDAPGDWQARLQQLQALLGPMVSPVVADAPRLAVLEQRAVDDRAALQRWLVEVIAADGEGLMLHAADAPYVTGRSEWLRKLKPQQDAEALVVGHLPGQGRHLGRLGALRVRDDAGRVFSLGSGLTDAQRNDPPPLGALVSYRHRGWTARGLPRFATFWRVVAWP